MPTKQRKVRKVGCQFCGYPVSQYHLKRHQQSEGHLDRVRAARAGASYQELPSDRAFTIFLSTIRRGTLRPFERRLFDEMKVA